MALHARSSFRVSLEGIREKRDYCLQSNKALAFLWFQQKVGVCRMTERNLRPMISTLCYYFLQLFLQLQHVQFIVIVCTVLRFEYLSPPIYKATKCKVNNILFLQLFHHFGKPQAYLPNLRIRLICLTGSYYPVQIKTGFQYNIYNQHTIVMRKIDFAHAR